MPKITSELALAAVTYVGARWIAFGITLLITVAAIWLVGESQPKETAAGKRNLSRFLKVLVGADGRVSTSRTVALAWTMVLAYMLLALIIVNPPSWPKALKHLSPTYLLLLGSPYAALILAKATVATRVASGSLAKPPPEDGPSLAQLFSDDSGTPDVFDIQYVVFNVVAIIFVVVAFGRAGVRTGLPSVPHGLLLLTGGPAAVYSANKFMPGTAPVIIKVSPDQVRVGQSFTVLGQNLTGSDPSAANPTVTVGSVAVTKGGTYAATSISLPAPDVGADVGRTVAVSVTTADGLQAVLQGAIEVLGPVPTLSGSDRGVASVGDRVGLRGDWDTTEAATIVVLVDTTVAAATERRTAGSVTFVVPPLQDLDPPRSVPVAVKLGAELSNSVNLLISSAAATPPAGPAVSSGRTVKT